MPVDCSHLDQIEPEVRPSGDGCLDCLRDGGHWVHLRMCRSCGHVGCCDSSPSRHASAHAKQPGHQVVSSFEPGEDWLWCYADEVAFAVPSLATYAHP